MAGQPGRSGGSRHGAGRKSGSPVAAKSREVAGRLLSDGKKSMLEIMVETARFHHDEASKLIADLMSGEKLRPAGEGADPHDPVVEAIRQVVGAATLALDAAKAAAPYLHPRLVDSVGAAARTDESVPLADRVAGWERDAKLAQAGSNVVDLTTRTE